MIEDNSSAKHSLCLTDRNKLEISGVVFVDSFDDTALMISTELGVLSIEGSDLKIEVFSKETKTAVIQGDIHSLLYLDESKRKKKLFERLFQ